MRISNYLANKLLDAVLNNTSFAVTTPYLSLHTGDTGITGANEVTGGSYARASASFAAAASGSCSSDADVSITGMPEETGSNAVRFWGLWDNSSGGNFLCGGPISTTAQCQFTVYDHTTDLVSSPAHGLSAGDAVVFRDDEGGTLPTGITEGSIYFVIASGLTTDVFKVSTTSGGSTIDITATGRGSFQKVVPKLTNAGDTFTILSTTLTVSLI